MTTQWKVQIDWDRDGDYTTTIDDMTDWVIMMDWALGMRKPYQDTSDNAVLSLKLSNQDRYFSPENTNSALHGKLNPQVPVRVVSDDGTSERVMWTGWIQNINPGVGRYGERIIQIIAHGPQPFYRATETKIELQEDKRTDEIIEQLVSEVVYPPKLAGVARLGIPGNQELGINTRLGDLRGYTVDNKVGQMNVRMSGY